MKELYETTDKAVDFLAEMVKDDQSFKKEISRIGKRSVAYANGDHTKRGDMDTRSIESVIVGNQHVMAKDNTVHGYQTNEISPIVRTLSSFLCGNKPTVTIDPDDDQATDKAIAKVSEKVIEAKYDLDNEYHNSNLSCFWAASLGSVFAKDYWDPSKGVFQSVNPETLEPEGDNEVAILTYFQMMMDNSNTDFTKHSWIGEQYLIDVDWARESYDSEEPGYLGYLDKISESNDLSDVLKYYEEMKLAVPYIGTKKGIRSKGKCLIREFNIAPNKDYRKGRYLVTAGGVPIYDSPPEVGNPYFMSYDPLMWHPYSYFFWEPYIGRFLGKSLVEQLVPLQMRLNEINAAIVQNAGTLAKPNILSAKKQLEKGVWDGGGYKVYMYNHIPNVPPPTFAQGIPLPAQFFEERQMIIDQMVRIAGTNFVMSGEPPKGVTAAAAIQSLLENANSQQSDLANRWHLYHEQRMTKKIRLIHKFNHIPNPALNKKLKMITRGCTDVSVNTFIGAQDLSDGIYIKVEQGSMLQKSKVAKMAGYKDLLAAGGFGPALAEDSPRGNKLRSELAKNMGVEPVEAQDSVEVKKACWENEKLLRGERAPVSADYDNHPIHIAEHILQIQSPTFLDNAEQEQLMALDGHIKEHQQIMAQKEAEAQQQQQAQAMQQQEQQLQMQAVSEFNKAKAKKFEEQEGPVLQ